MPLLPTVFLIASPPRFIECPVTAWCSHPRTHCFWIATPLHRKCGSGLRPLTFLIVRSLHPSPTCLMGWRWPGEDLAAAPRGDSTRKGWALSQGAVTCALNPQATHGATFPTARKHACGARTRKRGGWFTTMLNEPRGGTDVHLPTLGLSAGLDVSVPTRAGFPPGAQRQLHLLNAETATLPYWVPQTPN